MILVSGHLSAGSSESSNLTVTRITNQPTNNTNQSHHTGPQGIDPLGAVPFSNPKISKLQLTRLVPVVRSNVSDDMGQYGQGSDPYDGVDFRPVSQVTVDGWYGLVELVRTEAWSNIVWSGRRRQDVSYLRTHPFVVIDVDGLEDGWNEARLVEHVRSQGCPSLVIMTKTRGRYRVLYRTEREMNAAEHRSMHRFHASAIPGADASCLDLTDWYRPCVRHDNPDSGRVAFISPYGQPLPVLIQEDEGLHQTKGSVSPSLPLPVCIKEGPTVDNDMKGSFQGAGNTSAALVFALSATPATARADKTNSRGTRNAVLFKTGMTIARLLFDEDSLDAFEGVMKVYVNRCTPILSTKEVIGMGRRIRTYALQGKGRYLPWTKTVKKERLSPRERGIRAAEGKRLAKLRRANAVVGGEHGKGKAEDQGGAGDPSRGPGANMVSEVAGLPCRPEVVGPRQEPPVLLLDRTDGEGVLRSSGSTGPWSTAATQEKGSFEEGAARTSEDVSADRPAAGASATTATTTTDQTPREPHTGRTDSTVRGRAGPTRAKEKRADSHRAAERQRSPSSEDCYARTG